MSLLAVRHLVVERKIKVQRKSLIRVLLVSVRARKEPNMLLIMYPLVEEDSNVIMFKKAFNTFSSNYDVSTAH